jgi:hypothetical protein
MLSYDMAPKYVVNHYAVFSDLQSLKSMQFPQPSALRHGQVCSLRGQLTHPCKATFLRISLEQNVKHFSPNYMLFETVILFAAAFPKNISVLPNFGRIHEMPLYIAVD